MKITRKFKLTQYRLNIRKALNTASLEELKITLQEVKREIEQRNKQK